MFALLSSEYTDTFLIPENIDVFAVSAINVKMFCDTFDEDWLRDWIE